MTFIKRCGIEITQVPDKIHIYLKGNFDASISNQLLYFMRAYHNESQPIHVHTENVTSFDAFGLSLFQQSLGPLKNEYSRFIFTGEISSYLREAWSPADKNVFS